MMWLPAGWQFSVVLGVILAAIYAIYVWNHYEPPQDSIEEQELDGDVEPINHSAAEAPPRVRPSIPVLRGKKRRAAKPARIVIEFSYKNRAGVESRRRLDVISVGEDHFEGYCHLAQAMRTFAIDRVRGKVTDMETGDMMSARKWATEMRLRSGR